MNGSLKPTFMNYFEVLSHFREDLVISYTDHRWIRNSLNEPPIEMLVNNGFLKKFENKISLKTEYLMITEKGMRFLNGKVLSILCGYALILRGS